MLLNYEYLDLFKAAAALKSWDSGFVLGKDIEVIKKSWV